jgi:hypothetical protein
MRQHRARGSVGRKRPFHQLRVLRGFIKSHIPLLEEEEREQQQAHDIGAVKVFLLLTAYFLRKKANGW